MFLRPFSLDRFLSTVAAEEVFAEYCATRGIHWTGLASGGKKSTSSRRWAGAIDALPAESVAQVELELSMVNELAGDDATAQLIAAAGGTLLPPEDVPAGAPTALWFLRHRPALFREVFFHHEIREAGAWRTGKASAGIALPAPDERAAALCRTLCQFFKVQEGTGRFCSVDVTGLPDATGFLARIADRPRYVDGFSDAGALVAQKLRPAVTILFVYYPESGTVLLQSRLRAVDRVGGLFRCFGQAVLGEPVRCVYEAYDLDRLKFPFHPLPDADDIELVRVKSLHLRYPDRARSRLVKLETRTGDEPAAIEHLLRSHVDPSDLGLLRVSHAELQVCAKTDGRGRNHLVRLWPDRCSLNQSPAGNRLRACLRKWGLCYAE